MMIRKVLKRVWFDFIVGYCVDNILSIWFLKALGASEGNYYIVVALADWCQAKISKDLFDFGRDFFELQNLLPYTKYSQSNQNPKNKYSIVNRHAKLTHPLGYGFIHGDPAGGPPWRKFLGNSRPIFHSVAFISGFNSFTRGILGVGPKAPIKTGKG